MTRTLSADVAVVGSGPTGATLARELVPRGVRVLLLDAGPALGPIPGRHLRNTRIHTRDPYTYAALVRGLLHPLSATRPGRDGYNPLQDGARNLEDAATAYAVGGMGIHWTAVIPRPHPVHERTPVLTPSAWEAALDGAETVLGRHRGGVDAVRHHAVKAAVSTLLGPRLERGRGVHDLPMAVRPRRDGDGVDTVGVDDVLGPALGAPGLRVAAEHAVRRVVVRGGRARHLEAVDLARRERVEVHAERFVLAAGTVLNAQLLHVSGVRPRALGRFLVEHPLAYAQVELRGAVRARIDAAGPLDLAREPPPNVWVPLGDGRPWHVQITKDPVHFSAVPEGVDDARVVDLRWYAWLEPDPDNRVVFRDDGAAGLDALDLPRPTFHFALGDAARARIAAMMAEQREVADALGAIVPGGEPRLLPLGTCLHLQGATRAGLHDDGTAVVDPQGRVWGVDGLWVVGNSVIPTANACNPTLTAVAFALRTAADLVGAPPPGEGERARAGGGDVDVGDVASEGTS